MERKGKTMRSMLVFLLLGLCWSASAGELEIMSGSPNPNVSDYNLDREPIIPLKMDGPIWTGLQNMPHDLKINSEIELELEPNATVAALQKAEEIEKQWNSGLYDRAIQLFIELSDLTDINEVSIGNSWRIPLQTYEQPNWDTDVRIANRDSIYVNVLDIHNISGNLFAILLFQGDGYSSQWAVNLSTDGGQTWSETYVWYATFHINYMSATVVSNHCYVAYVGDLPQSSARIRRFRASDGQPENFGNGSAWIEVFTTTSPESILEVVLTSNQDEFNNRLYYLGLTSEGTIRYFWDDPDALNWIEVFTGVYDADRGLDACYNQGSVGYFLNISYIGQDNYLNIMGRSSGLPDNIESGLSDVDR